MKCEGKLVYKTGICAGNYKYFSSKSDADSFFSGKSKGTFSEYSVVRPDANSKNGFNIACVHVDMPYDDSILCDYVSIRNDGMKRWLHCIVVEREYVNEKSTRLYFTIDYVASYFDTITLGKCLIERTHVNDDWLSSGGIIPGIPAIPDNKYLLPEPISADSYDRPELVGIDIFKDVNTIFTKDNGTFSMVSSVDVNGDFSEPKLHYQSGGSVSGYVTTGTQERIEETMAKYVTYMNKMINMSNTMLNYVQSIYFLPSVVANNLSENGIKNELAPINLFLPPVLSAAAMPAIKNAKTYMYFFFTIRSGQDSYTFKLKDYGNFLFTDLIWTGGPNGNAKLRVLDRLKNFQGIEVNTPQWPNLTPSGVVQGQKPEINSGAKSYFQTSFDKFNQVFDKNQFPWSL